MRRIVVVSLVAALALIGAGCGGDESGEQYEDSGGSGNAPAPEPTNAVTAVAAFSEEDCLQEASESGELGVEISEPSQVPSYEVTEEEDVDSVREFEVVTGATSQEELRKIAEDVRYENRGADAISVDFYNGSGDSRRDAGLALIFNTREAACRAFQYPVGEQDELAAQNNGVTVLSVEEGV